MVKLPANRYYCVCLSPGQAETIEALAKGQEVSKAAVVRLVLRAGFEALGVEAGA